MARFCLIHGAWHAPSCWDALAAELRARGHEALTPDLPYHDPAATWADRVAPARAALAAAGDGPAVVVGHSMGSNYAPLVALGHPGSLVVHLCPRLGPFADVAGAPKPYRPGFRWPAAAADGTNAWDPQTAIEVLYPRLAPAAAETLAARGRPMALPPDDFPLPGHPDLATTLVYATHDEIFAPAWERFMARHLGVEAIELDTGHFPMVEDPAGLAGVLTAQAGAHLASGAPPASGAGRTGRAARPG